MNDGLWYQPHAWTPDRAGRGCAVAGCVRTEDEHNSDGLTDAEKSTVQITIAALRAGRWHMKEVFAEFTKMFATRTAAVEQRAEGAEADLHREVLERARERTFANEKIAKAEERLAAVEALRHKRVRVRKDGERHDYVRWSDLRAALAPDPQQESAEARDQHVTAAVEARGGVELRALRDRWAATRDGVLSPGLRQAVDDLDREWFAQTVLRKQREANCAALAIDSQQEPAEATPTFEVDEHGQRVPAGEPTYGTDEEHEATYQHVTSAVEERQRLRVAVAKALMAHQPGAFFNAQDGHRECYCGYVLALAESYAEHLADAIAGFLDE